MIPEPLLIRALDQMQQGCMVIAFDWTYLYVNEAAARHGRTERGAILGRRMTEAYPGVEQSEVFQAYRRCMEQRVPVRFEGRFTFQDGEARHYQMLVEPVPEGILVLSIDDTEQARAEEELREARDRYRALFVMAPVGMAEIDATASRVLRVNDRLCTLLGRTREDLAGLSWKDFTHADDIEGDLEANARMRRECVPVTRDKRYLRPDGTVVFARITITPLWHPGEPPTRYMALIEDTTGEHEARLSLATSDAALQAKSRALLLHDRVREAILRATSEVELFDAVCRAFVETGGYRMAWVGVVEHDERRTIRPVAHAGHDEGYVALVDVVWSDTPRGRGPAGTAVRERRPVTGAYVEQDPALAPWRAAALARGYLTSSGIPVLRDGEPIAVLSVYSSEARVMDGDELEVLRALADDLASGVVGLRRQEALRASEAKYRLLFDHAHVPMFRSQGDGGTILDANRRFFEHVGGTREQVLGQPAARFWADPEERGEMVRRLRAEGTVYEFEYQLRTLQGEIRSALVSATLHADTQVIEGSCIDITERKRTEEALARTQRLESLGTLAAGIAHDFNNMLTGVLANLSMARRPGAGEREDLLREAEAAAERARALTRQLLTFSRGGAPTKSVLLLGPLAQEAALFASRGATSRCRFDLPGDLWPVEADAGQLAQVVQNLVINALEATPGGDVIDISAANVELAAATRTTQPGRYVRLRVQDHGVGIPEESIARVFDPFFSTKNRGSGLGLSVVHSIVQRHGGTVEVRSSAGAGATFDVLLPAHAGAPKPVPAQSAAQAELHGFVLVMDDEPAVRRVMGRALGAMGAQVEEAADGAQAVEAWTRAREAGRPFDLVILDLTVPGGMGGVEALARMRAIDPAVRALASSGYSEDPVVARPGEHGFAGAIAKPWTIGRMHDAVARILGEGR